MPANVLLVAVDVVPLPIEPFPEPVVVVVGAGDVVVVVVVVEPVLVLPPPMVGFCAVANTVINKVAVNKL
jgi:hypothetical protein